VHDGKVTMMATTEIYRMCHSSVSEGRITQPLIVIICSELNDRGGSAGLTTRHPSICKSWHQISPIRGGHSFGIVRLLTKGHEFVLLLCVCCSDNTLSYEGKEGIFVTKSSFTSSLSTIQYQLCLSHTYKVQYLFINVYVPSVIVVKYLAKVSNNFPH
jgi:hypothetical protein